MGRDRDAMSATYVPARRIAGSTMASRQPTAAPTATTHTRARSPSASPRSAPR
ncbi:hypothetical protein V2I01_24365 [Micromonospora sp. BRA006-A]|nr:hypothetical protein [Micromonospora sp. BRA006-A]